MYQHASSDSLFQLYLSLRHPNLEYMLAQYGICRSGETNRIQTVQKFGIEDVCPEVG